VQETAWGSQSYQNDMEWLDFGQYFYYLLSLSTFQSSRGER
jgi:hypothetical protein